MNTLAKTIESTNRNDMSVDKDFIYKRISIFAGQEIDPNSDKQVEEILRRKFNILLPQRKTLNESLVFTKSDHEVIALILKYRTSK